MLESKTTGSEMKNASDGLLSRKGEKRCEDRSRGGVFACVCKRETERQMEDATLLALKKMRGKGHYPTN